MLAATMNPVREALDEDVFNELHIAMNGYPPDDFAEMYKWKELGINASKFDLEVMDPAFFAAVCPGKYAYRPLEHWKEAQDASLEIFGPGRGTVTSLVVGMEPMDSLIEGIDERLSKGIFPIPLNFVPTSGSAFGRFRPPTAAWSVEAPQKTADCFFRHADKLDRAPTDDPRPGYTRTARSYHSMLTTDEITRRAQEQGLLPPGLPKQNA